MNNHSGPPATDPIHPSRPDRIRQAGRWLSPLAWLRVLTAAFLVPYGTRPQWHCPACGTPRAGRAGPALTATGRCTRCHVAAGPGPWALEALVVAAVLLVLTGARTGLEQPAFLWFAVLGVVLAVVDGTVRRLPHALTAAWAAGTLAGLLIPAARFDRYDDWTRALLAGTVTVVIFAVCALARPGSLGWGDVTAAAGFGIALGWLGWLPLYAGTFLAFTAALVYVLARQLVRRATHLPFGPFLVGAAVLVGALLPAGR
ncbi:prepilin peptidase [Actinoplanes sp. L3-i22]|uniref:prepilin peptidase n=1 Tax=Actinoplanes sp. L3-i22 TaxID=2836373 RepID=UPI001C76D81D|nr:prepilin peptidase [Actinoplanes sp. L3-i22]BCY10932.1 hypothetical protein L3i22_060200 [Actinoplanes sp. L3-i22]